VQRLRFAGKVSSISPARDNLQDLVLSSPNPSGGYSLSRMEFVPP
jgi:hypothetical protein